MQSYRLVGSGRACTRMHAHTHGEGMHMHARTHTHTHGEGMHTHARTHTQHIICELVRVSVLIPWAMTDALSSCICLLHSLLSCTQLPTTGGCTTLHLHCYILAALLHPPFCLSFTIQETAPLLSSCIILLFLYTTAGDSTTLQLHRSRKNICNEHIK